MAKIEYLRLTDAIAEISLPETGALAIEDLESLAAFLEHANDDETLRVLVVRSRGVAFSNGVDLLEFAAVEDCEALSSKVRRFFEALTRCDKVMIAAVDGRCIGLGMTMLLHFDVVIATDVSRFAAPFVDLGLVPEAASTLLTVERFGYLKAFDLLCNSREIEIDEAVRIGLVGQRVGRNELLPTAYERARRLAHKPPAILRSIRRLLRSTDAVCDRVGVELQLFEQCLGSTTTRRRLAIIGRRAIERSVETAA